MTITDFIVKNLGVSADLLVDVDANTITGLQAGVPKWPNLYTLADWAETQAMDHPDRLDAYQRLETTCKRLAADSFAATVLKDKANVEIFSEDFRWRWADLYGEVGDLYADGEDVPADAQKAIGCYQIMRLLGNDAPYADACIGMVYYRGCGAAPDYAKALDYFLLSKDGEKLGDYYAEGKAQAPDYPKAIAYYLQYVAKHKNDLFPTDVEDVLGKLSACYEQTGDAEKARAAKLAAEQMARRRNGEDDD